MKQLTCKDLTKAEKIYLIIDFLKELQPKQFYYSRVIKEFDGLHNCGTVGCVMGWLPAIFPKDFKWDKADSNGIFLNTPKAKSVISEDIHLQQKLNLTKSELMALMYGSQDSQRALGLPNVGLYYSDNNHLTTIDDVIKLFEAFQKSYCPYTPPQLADLSAD